MTKKYIGGVSIDTDKEMKQRHKQDFYPTEQALIDAYLKKSNFYNCLRQGVKDFSSEELEKRCVADFGAGDGRWGIAVKNKYPYVNLVGNDIRNLPRPEGFNEWTPEFDFINHKWFGSTPDLIVGNPPYSILEAWLEKCFEIVNKDWGVVSLLLSINALSGLKRYKKFYSNGFPISKLWVCSTRPSFTENGKTYPGREYAIFEWWFSDNYCLTSEDLGDRCILPIDFIVYDRKRPDRLQK
jgi:hypothetical protein